MIGFKRRVALLVLSLASLAAPAVAQVVEDEATKAGRTEQSFPHAGEPYFREMDNGVALGPLEEQGRNMWLVWTGGNDRFWNEMGKPTLGGFDLLKIVAPPKGSPLNRPTRWSYLGAINEPCFEPALETGDPARFGLRLDMRRSDCAPDPFADPQKYPGVKIGARGTTFADGSTLPVGSYYGEPTGILGLRLFTNPDFDETAKQRWDVDKYYNDPRYYTDPTLVRPYRVGMACGFCHVGPSPISPPQDAANPSWSNLNSTVGAQYLWVDRLFLFDPQSDNFMYQILKTYRPGTMDTSLVSTDSINNPRTMNAVYGFAARMKLAKQIGKEKLAGDEKRNRQLNEFIGTGPLTEFFKAPDQVWTPHVLKDGSDSVGVLGALNRVYLNIGLYSEEWLTHFVPVIGAKKITPIKIKTAQDHSAYWRATELGTPSMAMFLLAAGQPDALAKAPGGPAYVSNDAAVLAKGRDAFANTCARCHSSKSPAPPSGLDLNACNGPSYMGCFKRWWSWTQTDAYKTAMRSIVLAPDFANDNFLSTDARIPVTLLRTNVCSPLATNALKDNIWNDFSSASYKSLPRVGSVTLQDPFTGDLVASELPDGGRGYTRVPSLISIWSTAPFLLNNTVGAEAYGTRSSNASANDPSVEARMTTFDASIRQLLWPETRERDALLGDAAQGRIDRVDTRSYLLVPPYYVGDLQPWLDDRLFNEHGFLKLGPMPIGMPVNLLANLKAAPDPNASWLQENWHYWNLANLLWELSGKLLSLPDPSVSNADLRDHFASIRDNLMSLSKCKDFVVNRGHYFGTAKFNDTANLTSDEQSFGTEPALTDDEKNALIEFLKTL